MCDTLCFYTGELIGVEYLFSQTRRAFQEDVGVDPDIPDGIRDEDLQGDLEGDEGFEDLYFDEHTEFMELECNPLLELTEALQPPGLSSSQTDPAAESSLPATSTQSQVNEQTHKHTVYTEIVWCVMMLIFQLGFIL